MSFCSYDKAGHRFWILADTPGQKMMGEFLELVQVKGSEQTEESGHLSYCGRCHESTGKRILLDPLLDKRVETTALSGRWRLWFLLSDLPDNFFLFCF
ncbi:hypothetical protein KOW79_003299 [Hemibagrus wyckioides]|uniref:Uncharacterized protein n=1 Tax=Hemibagrus wyckioides TaxID=337641 RepID=A0A9D3P3X5_9TELE|nr:hypothetical protein KOW79_003299 [Hemibagrus wyckioides]